MNLLANVHPLFFALGATLCFSYASTIFTEFSRSVSPEWMNAFKAVIALILFTITLFSFNLWIPPASTSVYVLLGSGLLGLMIGDMYMLKAMKELGIKPIIKPIRGGTDGCQLSYKGLPCPNIFAGGHNFHGKYEYVPVESMVKATEVIVKIAEITAARKN